MLASSFRTRSIFTRSCENVIEDLMFVKHFSQQYEIGFTMPEWAFLMRNSQTKRLKTICLKYSDNQIKSLHLSFSILMQLDKKLAHKQAAVVNWLV